METEYQRAVLQSRILWIWLRQSFERGDEKHVQQKYAEAWTTICDNIINHRTSNGHLGEAGILFSICPTFPWQGHFEKSEIFQKSKSRKL